MGGGASRGGAFSRMLPVFSSCLLVVVSEAAAKTMSFSLSLRFSMAYEYINIEILYPYSTVL